MDFVVTPFLLSEPTTRVHLLNREMDLERSGEIIAKKMWHRGNQTKGRDLFDLAAVFESEPREIELASEFMRPNARAFLDQIDTREVLLELEFQAIDRVDFHLTFRECVEIARGVLRPLF